MGCYFNNYCVFFSGLYYALVDGNRFPQTTMRGETVVKGDARSKSIAAASILAKVTRDRVMVENSKSYPEWGFEGHKGYPTKQHRAAIEKYGLSPLHRQSFRFKSLSKLDRSSIAQLNLL